MGSTIGKITRRSVKNWNVENRAHKVIEKHKDKPIAAPRHQSSKENNRLAEIDQEFTKSSIEKNENLHQMLHGLVVEPEKMPEITAAKPGLPQDRRRHTDPEFGFIAPVKVREGKCTLKQAVQFISLHSTDPVKHSAESIAKEYKLDENVVRNILLYFRALDLYVPEDDSKSKDENQLKKLNSKNSKLLENK
ncbi:DgyrCDS1287 [Dimorphilus gyrociliatus]|uniref:DgyrCDS1287 n=1 Tax=Dimorphilus gyrociliatus TaxID=2664684 RepID=A0A7I8V6T1_9ANNE|nr:DgyrCDS1287 [Dimorphilus gyrociliatus]